MREEVNRTKGEGFSVDDDNEHVIENAPALNKEANAKEFFCGNCTRNVVGFCDRKSLGRKRIRQV